MKKVYKSKNYKMLLGVCGGIATYFGVKPLIIRILFIILLITTHFLAVISYLVMSFIIPLETDIIDIEN